MNILSRRWFIQIAEIKYLFVEALYRIQNDLFSILKNLGAAVTKLDGLLLAIHNDDYVN